MTNLLMWKKKFKFFVKPPILTRIYSVAIGRWFGIRVLPRACFCDLTVFMWEITSFNIVPKIVGKLQSLETPPPPTFHATDITHKIIAIKVRSYK